MWFLICTYFCFALFLVEMEMNITHKMLQISMLDRVFLLEMDRPENDSFMHVAKFMCPLTNPSSATTDTSHLRVR